MQHSGGIIQWNIFIRLQNWEFKQVGELVLTCQLPTLLRITPNSVAAMEHSWSMSEVGGSEMLMGLRSLTIPSRLIIHNRSIAKGIWLCNIEFELTWSLGPTHPKLWTAHSIFTYYIPWAIAIASGGRDSEEWIRLKWEAHRDSATGTCFQITSLLGAMKKKRVPGLQQTYEAIKGIFHFSSCPFVRLSPTWICLQRQRLS